MLSSLPFATTSATSFSVYPRKAQKFAQLARGLLNNEAYRVCENPECGRLFTPREMGRRLDTKYCRPECQERAKRLRYVASHR